MTDTIPRCCAPHRLAALEHLGDLLARDAYYSVREMVRDGWPVAAAVQSYRGWVVEKLSVDIAVGALFAESAG